MEEQESPLFRQTALEVAEIAADPDSGADRLSRLVLRDPLLATRILRLSNTAYYNPSGRPIQTIDRAILLLGLERIRALCLSAMLVEIMHEGKRLQRLQHELGRSIHAALLARSLGLEMMEGALDEIFLAALMRHIGHLLFWSLGGEEATTLDGILRGTAEDQAAEKAVLGFHLAQITLMATEEWKLSKLLLDLFREDEPNGAMRCVQQGWALAQSLEDGWGTQHARDGIGNVATFLDIDCAQAAVLMARATRDAHAWASEMGAEDVSQVIPTPPEEGSEVDSLFVDPEPSSAAVQPDSVRVPHMAQTLHDLASIKEVTDFHRIPAIMLGGLHIGLGMDRALFAVHLPSSGELRCRSALGEGAEDLLERWRFIQRFQMADSFSRALEAGTPLEYDPADAVRPPSLPEPLDPILRGAAFVFLPVHVQGKLMGAFCADRGPSQRGLDPVVLEGFHILCGALSDAINRVKP